MRESFFSSLRLVLATFGFPWARAARSFFLSMSKSGQLDLKAEMSPCDTTLVLAHCTNSADETCGHVAGGTRVGVRGCVRRPSPSQRTQPSPSVSVLRNMSRATLATADCGGTACVIPIAHAVSHHV